MSTYPSESAASGQPRLVPLPDAARLYRGVSIRSLRSLIKRGRLPATKVGRAYLVDPRDVAALLQPTLRSAQPERRRESESARIERQLRNAGVAT